MNINMVEPVLIKELYGKIRQTIRGAIPQWWPHLGEVLSGLITEPSPPEAILPIAACLAVGGIPEKVVPISAAFLTLGMSVRIFDDVFDEDKEVTETIPRNRVCNYAASIQNIAYSIINKSSFHFSLKQTLLECLIETFFAIAAGQDRDIAGIMETLEEYWLTVELKSASIYAAACSAGGLTGTNNQEHIDACRSFGRHLGRSIQALNDMDSIWNSGGRSDLDCNKITLPVLYGLFHEHNAKDELTEIVNSHRLALEQKRVIAILEDIGTKDFLVWTALQERDSALEAARVLPNQDGRDMLYAYITGIFGDLVQEK
jgi:geranylgeranyl pyrophosphate synthase